MAGKQEKKNEEQQETRAAPHYTGNPQDLEGPPSPDGQDYVYVDKPHETIVGYQEQISPQEQEQRKEAEKKDS